MFAVLAWFAAGSVTHAAGGSGRDDRWEETLDHVTQAVVSIRMDRPRSYEGVGRSNSQATGFVIDAERGLLLTNRHVVTSGPVVAEAIFLDHEVVPLTPVYRDPVHDFGLFRFDPSLVRFQEVHELALRPDKARPGVQVRVVGNDSGEQLSILDGTIARIDREAPAYGGTYSDFDTFYLQAASATSGGSSGSPVVDAEGDVLAINAGGKTTAATSFYLPLDRVVRAVELVKAGRPVPRGTFQTRMVHTSYDELRKLGLPPDAEAAARARDPKGTGLLVVREVLRGGPAEGRLQIGDIVLEVGGTSVAGFVAVEAELDDHVGDTLPVVVSRRGATVATEVQVDDLHALVPSALLEIGGAVIHDLSLHQARASQIAVRGAVLADDGRMFERAGIPTSSVLVEVGGIEVAGVVDLAAQLALIPDGQAFNVRSFRLSQPQLSIESSVLMDRRWFPARVCRRDDTHGTWPCTDLAEAPAADGPPARVDVGFPPTDQKVGRLLQPSLVRVRVEVPYPVAGAQGTSYFGTGLVVDAERGWVLVDRDTAPIALGEAWIELAGATEIQARILAVHPIHDLAILAYDPAEAAGVPLVSATLAGAPLAAGDERSWVGTERDGTVVVREVKVERVEPFGLRADGPPRFRETNLEVVSLEVPPPGQNGVIVDKKGRVGAYWASLAYNEGNEPKAVWAALPVELVAETVALASGSPIGTLPWELGVLALPKALERGLPPAVVETLVAHDPERRGVLQVIRAEVGHPLADATRPGDLVVAIDGQTVTRFREVETSVAFASSVRLTLCRAGQLLDVQVPTQDLETIDVDRVVMWAGARIHTPHRAARLFGVDAARPYVSWWEGGSPAGRGELRAQRSIVSVNGLDTPDLDTFLETLLALDADATIQLALDMPTGEREVVVVEPDETFFPTTELVRNADGTWERRALR
jgi:S1-C subfamily serine protease